MDTTPHFGRYQAVEGRSIGGGITRAAAEGDGPGDLAGGLRARSFGSLAFSAPRSRVGARRADRRPSRCPMTRHQPDAEVTGYIAEGRPSSSDDDRRIRAFVDEFERQFIGQGEQRRTIEETLDLVWAPLERFRRTSSSGSHPSSRAPSRECAELVKHGG